MFCNPALCGRETLIEEDPTNDLKILVAGPHATGKSGEILYSFTGKVSRTDACMEI